jgi:hypothetical protein
VRARAWMIGLIFFGVVTAQAAAVGLTPACEEIHSLLGKALTQRGVPAAQLPSLDELDCTAVPPRAGPLAVEHVNWDAQRRAFQFRIACSAPQRCLPFLVHARVGETKAALIRESLDIVGEGERPTRRVRLRTGGHSPNRSLVSPGRPATLLVERDGMRIRASVTCLERGGKGEIVRVRLHDTRQLFRAQVIGDALVKLF